MSLDIESAEHLRDLQTIIQPSRKARMNKEIQQMFVGTVKFFDQRRGCGFVTRDDNAGDVFVHARALERARIASLAEGDKIEFDIGSHKGSIRSCRRSLAGRVNVAK